MSPRALLRPLAALVLAVTALGTATAPAVAAPVNVSGTVTLTPGTTTTGLYVLVYDAQEIETVSYAEASQQTGEYTLQVEPGTYTFSVFFQSSHNENGHYAQSATTTYTRNVVVDGDTVVNLTPVPTLLAEVNLVDTSGNDVPTTRSLTCRRGPEDTDRQHDDQRTSSGGSEPDEHMMAVIPTDASAGDGSGCQLVLQPTEPPFDDVTIVRENITFTDEPNQVLDIVMPDLVTVTGKVTAQTDEPMYGGRPAVHAMARTTDSTFSNRGAGTKRATTQWTCLSGPLSSCSAAGPTSTTWGSGVRSRSQRKGCSSTPPWSTCRTRCTWSALTVSPARVPW